MQTHLPTPPRAVAPLVAACLFVAGCGGYAYTTTSDLSQGGTSGQLSQDAFQFQWSPGAQWDGGHCLDMRLTNQGRPVYWWTLQLQMTDIITSITSSYGATFEIYDDQLVINPAQGALEYGDFVEFQMCFEPDAVPQAIADLTFEPAVTTGTPTPTHSTGGGNNGTPTQTPEPTPAGAGSVYDDPIFVVYRHGINSRGGGCLDLELTNGGERDLASWKVTLFASGPVEITDYWGAFNVIWWDTNRIEILPEEWAAELDAYESVDGTICMSPRSDLDGLNAEVTYK